MLPVPCSARHALGTSSTHRSSSCLSGRQPTSSATTPTIFDDSWRRQTLKPRSWTSEDQPLGAMARAPRMDTGSHNLIGPRGARNLGKPATKCLMMFDQLDSGSESLFGRAELVR